VSFAGVSARALDPGSGNDRHVVLGAGAVVMLGLDPPRRDRSQFWRGAIGLAGCAVVVTDHRTVLQRRLCRVES
jgi:hypothetical protein